MNQIHTDLIYTKERRRKQWPGGKRAKLNGELVTAKQIAELAGCSVPYARQRCIVENRDPAEFIESMLEKKK